MRAIWRCWEKREPLAYEGEHYRFTLMTPEFSPPPSSLPPVPVYIAAVRPAMIHLAGRVCDGVRLHGFCTRRYLTEVAVPNLARFRGKFVTGGSDDHGKVKTSETLGTVRVPETLIAPILQRMA